MTIKPAESQLVVVVTRFSADIINARRKVRLRFVDSQIAAVAISNGLTLYTGNARDFAGIRGLDVVHVRYDG